MKRQPSDVLMRAATQLKNAMDEMSIDGMDSGLPFEEYGSMVANIHMVAAALHHRSIAMARTETPSNIIDITPYRLALLPTSEGIQW